MNTQSLVPILQQEINAISVRYGRHQIAQELAMFRRLAQVIRTQPDQFIYPSGGRLPNHKAEKLETIKLQVETLVQLAEIRFPRTHRRCIVCRELIDCGDQWFCTQHRDADLHREDYPSWR